MTRLGVNLTAFLTLLAIGVAISFLSVKKNRILKERHADTWRALGQPQLFWTTIRNQQMTSGFLWGRRYRDLADAELTTVCDGLRSLNLAFGVVFGAWAVWMAFGGLR